MNNAIFKDDMLKESKLWKTPMLFFFILASIFPLALIWNEIKMIDFILGEAFLMLIGCYFLYCYLYTCKYKVIVTDERIFLRTLFKSVDIEFKNVDAYYCKRYRKTQFYQFIVLCKNNKTIIITRFKDELEKALVRNTGAFE